MATNFAKTAFGATADEKAVVVDIYATPPLKPVNTKPKNALGIFGDFINPSGLSGGLIKQLTTNYIKTGRFLEFSKQGAIDGAIRGAAAMLGVPGGNLYDIGGATLNNVLKSQGFYGTDVGQLVQGISYSITGNTLEKNLAGGYKDVVVAVNDAQKLIKNVRDVENFSDLANVLSTITGDSSFVKVFDLTEAAGVIKGINDLSSGLQIPGVLDRLIEDMSGGNDDTAYYLSRVVATGVSTWGTDLTQVDTMLSNMTGAELLASNPLVLEQMVNTFTANETYPRASVEAANALLKRLEAIDPNWDKCLNMDLQLINRQDIFNHFSSFAKECFLLADLYKAQLAISPATVSKTFNECACSLYPLTFKKQ